MAKDAGLIRFDIPLTGKLNTADDPILLGEGNFRQLVNLRYGDKNPKGVAGMTKINSSALANTDGKSLFHFRKDAPTESHVLVHSAGETTSAIYKSDNTAGIPSADTFTSLKELAHTNPVYFGEAPDGSCVGFDGVNNYIYSGDEYRMGKFIASTAAITNTVTNAQDYSDALSNTLTTATNVATVGGSGPVLLLHGEGTDASTTITDSSTSAHTCTANGDCQIDTAYFKFGSGSILFDGNGDYVTVPDHANFNFGTGNFTIDFWVNFAALPALGGYMVLASQYEDANNYWQIHLFRDITDVYYLYMCFVDGGATKGYYRVQVSPYVGQWYHVAFVRNATSGKIFFNGADGGTTVVGSGSFGTNDVGDMAANLYIGAVNDAGGPHYYLNGRIDEFRILKGTADYWNDFTPPPTPYGSAYSYFVVGSTRPLEGVKFYVNSANTTTSTLTCKEWNGASWTSLTVTDNTSSGGVALAQTGTVTWSSTESSSKIKYLEGVCAYWYQFYLSAGSAQLYYVTTKPGIQPLVDIWDGTARTAAACFMFKTNYEDYTTNVLAADFYTSSETYTFMNLGGLTSSQYIYVGFPEKIMGLNITIPGANGNTTAATTMSIARWDGSAWVAASGLSDGTSNGSISLAQSGTVTWTSNPSIQEEVRRTISNSSQWYYYRISTDKTLSETVYIDCITGIPAQKSINPHRFPVFWQNRLWMLDEVDGERNSALCSGYGTNCVFNGYDSIRLPFGDSTALTAGSVVFTRFAGELYENMIVTKLDETYLVDGTGTSNFRVIKISDSIGCNAPFTMKSCSISYEIAEGIAKHIAVWLSAAGVVAFDTNSLVFLHGDIDDRFDPASSNYINTSIVNKFHAFYDSTRKEYHLSIATGSSTTLNEEWVYDLIRKRWFQIDRGSTKRLEAGCEAVDTLGNKYCYGLTGGYVERLEYGTTFDGNSIAYDMWLAESPLPVGQVPSAMYTTVMRKLALYAKAKATTAQTIAITHYADGYETSTSIGTVDPTKSGYRYVYPVKSFTVEAVFHSLRFQITTTDETVGFEPLLVSGYYQVGRELVA